MTKKFTYEGSNKFCKSIYLIGLGIAQIGMLFWIVTALCSIYFLVDLFFITRNFDVVNTDNLMIFGIAVGICFAFEILGTSIISLSQFINWWDRGSVNTKITRNVRK